MERSDVYDGSEASCLKPEREEDLVDFSALISDLVSLHAKLSVKVERGFYMMARDAGVSIHSPSLDVSPRLCPRSRK